MKKFVSLVIIGFVLFQCEEPKAKPQAKPEPKANKELSPVIISGQSDDAKALEYFTIINNSYLFGTNHSELEKAINQDALEFKLEAVEYGQFMDYLVFGDGQNYRGKIYLAPGDSINFKLQNGELKFMGDNAPANNFFSALERHTKNYYNIPYTGQLGVYKDTLAKAYKEKRDFLTAYLKQHHITSQDLIARIESELKFEYLYNLISPRTENSSSSGVFFNNDDKFLEIIQNETKRDERLLRLSDYFDKVALNEFQDRFTPDNDYLKRSINLFIRYYFNKNEYPPYSKGSLLAEKQFIEEQLQGELKDYALAKMISDYTKNGLGHSLANNTFMRDLANTYKSQFSKPSFVEKMEEIEADLSMYNSTLSESALEAKFVNVVGDTLSLKDIFSQSSKRIRVIDFWASWCAPCLAEIVKAKSLRDELSVNDNAEWIYISVDRNKDNWLKKAHEFEADFNTRHQYLLLNADKSALSKELKVNFLPKYVVFDKKNRIISESAPKPSDTVKFRKIIESIVSEKD